MSVTSNERALLAALMAVFAAVCISLLWWYPPIWPDEAAFADAALGLLRRGHLGSSLLGPVIPGIERHMYWQPPVYPLFLAGVMACFGARITAIRLASVALGLSSIGFVHGSARHATGSGRAGLMAAAVLALDPLFIRAASMARMDMLAITLTLFAVWLVQRRALLGAGVSSALAVLTHPLGILSFVLVGTVLLLERRRPTGRDLVRLLGPMVLLGAAWAVYILRDPANFAAQMHGQLLRKMSLTPWQRVLQVGGQYGVGQPFSSYVAQAHGRTESYPLLLVVYAWAVSACAVQAVRTRSRPIVFAVVAAVLAVALSTWAGESWYPPYFVPWVALAWAVAATQLQPRPVRMLTVAAGLMALVATVSNLVHMERLHHGASADRTSYQRYCESLLRDIPDGATVFDASLPDPFFWTLANRHVTLIGYPPPHFGADIRPALAQSDWLVISYNQFTHQLLTAGDPVIEAALAHANPRLVGEPGGASYSGVVVKLR